MIQTQTLPFAEWLPDQPAYGNQVQVCKNAIPQARGYRSVNDIAAFSNALDGRALGAYWVKDKSGNYFNFAGDSTKLYKLSGATFSNVSKSGNYSGVTGWEFVKWGERVIAVSIDAATQYYDMGTSSLFADLSGSPPKAKHAAVIRDFIFLGNIDDGTYYPERVQWSGYNNSEIWTSSITTQSDYQDLRGRGGAIQRIVPGEYGIIFREHAIVKVTYEGPPRIFRFDEIIKDMGTPCSNSVCWQGSTIYFYAHDGFYVFDGINKPVPIGEEKVNRWFADDFDDSDPDKLYGAIDRKNKAVYWCYPSNETGGQRLLCYKPDLKRWSVVDVSANFIFEWASAAYDLDTIDSLLTNGIDIDSFNMDASPYKGGSIDLVAFDTSHKLSTFAGDPLTATIETGEIGDPMRRIKVISTRPVTDGTTSLSIASRDTQAGNYSFGTPVTRNAKGECNFLKSSRYHRFRASIADGFNDAQGVQVIFRKEGRQ